MIDRRIRGWWLAAFLSFTVPSAAQIPAAPGNQGAAPRDEHPGHSKGGLAPVVVPTESEPTAPEIIDLMKRSRANAEGTSGPKNAVASPKPTPKPKSHKKPAR